MGALKERLEILVAKTGDDTRSQLLLEQVLQLERIANSLETGIVVYEGGPAVDVEEGERDFE